MRISDWSSDVCSSDLDAARLAFEMAGEVQAGVGIVGAVEPDGGDGRQQRGERAGRQPLQAAGPRSEERRVGEECVSTCGAPWSTSHEKKNNKYRSQF